MTGDWAVQWYSQYKFLMTYTKKKNKLKTTRHHFLPELIYSFEEWIPVGWFLFVLFCFVFWWKLKADPPKNWYGNEKSRRQKSFEDKRVNEDTVVLEKEGASSVREIWESGSSRPHSRSVPLWRKCQHNPTRESSVFQQTMPGQGNLHVDQEEERGGREDSLPLFHAIHKKQPKVYHRPKCKIQWCRSPARKPERVYVTFG